MTIEIKIFGFGDERPPAFGDKNKIEIEIATPASPRALLRALGIHDETGLVLMDQDSVVPEQCWDDAAIGDGQKLTLMSAFEGG